MMSIIMVVGIRLRLRAESGALVSNYKGTRDQARHRLNGYLAQRVPSIFLASSFRMCLNHGVLKGMFPWRTRWPLG